MTRTPSSRRLSRGTSDLLFSDNLELFAPDLLFEEFGSYKHVLPDKTGREEQAFLTLLYVLKSRIAVVPAETISGATTNGSRTNTLSPW